MPFNESSALVWHAAYSNMTYAADFASASTTVHVPITPALLNNATLFAHIFATKAGVPPDPKRDGYDRWAVSSMVHELVAYGERLQPKGLYNLLTGEVPNARGFPWRGGGRF